MSEMLLSVSEHLLGPGGLSIEQLPGVLGDLAGPGIDAADLYFQSQVSETWVLEDGIVKEGSFHLDQGVGVRAQSGEKPVSPTAMRSPPTPWRRPRRPRARLPAPDRTAGCKPSAARR